MTSARWRRVEELCHAALERDESVRAAFLTTACGEDDALRREVEALLAHERSAAGFLGGSIGAVAAAVMCGDDLVGQRVGPYGVVSRLGAGGMGEVYRARDPQLGREVAIKVLPRAFTADRDRLARFEREARVLASLNHPHIGAIYGVERLDPSTGSEHGGGRALVLELVEGKTLSERIDALRAIRKELSIEDTLRIARQIAEALEAAHEKGIVHRDLKPANVMITRTGTVKVLDFGLAQTAAGEPGQAGAVGWDGAQGFSPVELTHSPTFSATHDGALLGTAAYMSPEQARGQAVDKRADIWAFGCIFYEMLTGRLTFPGSIVSTHIAAILEREPDWNALPPATPEGIRRLLRRCLEKDPARRLHDVADARIEIDDAISSSAGAAVATRPSRRPAPMAFAALAGVALLAVLVTRVLVRPPPAAADLPLRFTMSTPGGQSMNISGVDRDVAISPDGRRIVYRSGGSITAGSSLLVRAIDQLDAVPLAGVGGAYGPFFSPDGAWVGFFAEGELRKISVTGGPALTLCAVNGRSLGASWGDDNAIVFATSDPASGLWRVSADGGEPAILTRPDPAQGETDHVFPWVLPGGGAVLFTITAVGGVKNSQVAVLDRKTGQRKTLVRGGSQAEYVETSTRSEPAGYLIYASGALLAVRFDPVRLDVRDPPVPVVEHPMIKGSGAANYAISRTGALLYVSAGADAQRPQRSLVWVDRNGREQPINAPLRTYGEPRLSPDGTRIVMPIADDETDLWIWDLAKETLTRATFGAGLDGMMPVWTPDSRQIVFMSTRSGVPNLYAQAADGTGAAAHLEAGAIPRWPTSITPDGRTVIGFETVLKSRTHVIRLPRPAASSRWRPESQVEILFDGAMPEISPDGRYVAYHQWNEDLGHLEVYVRPFPGVDSGRWQISTAGGSRPAWGGRELFYLDASNAMIAVPVQTSGPTFVAGNHVKLFDTKYPEPNPARHYDVSRDGRRFLMLKDSAADNASAKQPSMVVVEHWFEELKAKAGARQP